MAGKLTFVNKTTLNEIEVCREDDCIYVGGDRHTISDRNVSTFIWKVAAAFPSTCTYAEILEVEEAQVNHAEAHRIHSKAKQLMRSLRSGHDFFENIRAKGYSISEHWIPKEEKPSGSPNDLLMDTLSALVERSIKVSRERPIERDKSGLSYIRIKSDYAMSTFRELNALYWEILEHTSKTSNSIEILQLRDPLFKMMTYLLFWRVGDRLEDDQWRSDYEREIRVLTKQIAVAYEGI